MLARQEFYHLSHLPALAVVILEMCSLELFAWDGLKLDPPNLSL
jgi:hypothetical protein